METTFEEVSDGYILNGSKNWELNAPFADVFYNLGIQQGKKFTVL